MKNYKHIKINSVDCHQIIKETISHGRPIIVKAYCLLDETEKIIDFILEEILIKQNKIEYKTTIYTCLKEVTINAVRTNAKMMYLTENDLNFSNENDYFEGLKQIKNLMSENWIRENSKKSKEINLNVQIFFYYNADGLRIGNTDNATKARIEFPFTENFVSVRGSQYYREVENHLGRKTLY